MIKKILVLFIIIQTTNCGFVPMLKNFDTSKLEIKKIEYNGKSELIYLLKNNLNINENKSADGLIINLLISEKTEWSRKNTSGITTEELLTISIKLDIQDNNLKNLLKETLTESSRINVTNNLSTDDSTKNIIRNKLINELAQKIKFKLMVLTKR